MKKLTLAAALFLVVLSGCTNDNKTSETVTKTEIDFSQGHKVKHSFSDLTSEDTFEVKLTGNKPDNMILAFTITRNNGDKIYDIKIKATDLLGSMDPNVDLSKEPAQIEFIKNVANEFLSEEKFLVPAVTATQEPDDYAPDKTFYEELKKSGLNGFTYRLGKENNYYIAWSAKEQKVKVYYNCC